MTSSFTQQHVEELRADGLSSQQFINLAIQTSKALGWAVSNVNETGFIAYTTNGTFNWNAQIKFKIIDGNATLLSQSRNIRAVEFGKDKINLENFIAAFNEMKKAIVSVEISSFVNLPSRVA